MVGRNQGRPNRTGHYRVYSHTAFYRKAFGEGGQRVLCRGIGQQDGSVMLSPVKLRLCNAISKATLRVLSNIRGSNSSTGSKLL
jgi:hypothetical protein